METAFTYLCDQYFFKTDVAKEALVETPPTGLYHPNHKGYFATAQEYLDWHRAASPLPADAPTVAVLLYRKHVITRQLYIDQLIGYFEEAGLRPLPLFINGVEAHTIVRDQLTTAHEQAQRAAGVVEVPSLKADAVSVEAVVNTIGFPLVGGPAGTMEGACSLACLLARTRLYRNQTPFSVVLVAAIDTAGEKTHAVCFANDGSPKLRSVLKKASLLINRISPGALRRAASGGGQVDSVRQERALHGGGAAAYPGHGGLEPRRHRRVAGERVNLFCQASFLVPPLLSFSIRLKKVGKGSGFWAFI